MNYLIRITLIGLISILTLLSEAQEPTLGLITNTEEAFNGYTLFTPSGSRRTYLIDNCGEIVNLWTSDKPIGTSAYLLSDGSLMRTSRINGSFNGGGISGGVEQFDWDGNLIWDFDFTSLEYHAHHDIEILPNGNILMVAWERKNAIQAAEKGKEGNVSGQGLWPDFVVEIEQTGFDTGEIVWEWHVWDHLVQDHDSNLEGFGVIADHPEKININYQSNGSDWNHINAINYNEALDQIVLSSRHFDELWIIDHSTTTEEAAGDSGGNSGKGGDLLYRWGNPITYDQGTEDDQKLFGQHDTRWIASGLANEGQIMLYNNGQSRSSIGRIIPPLMDDGNYKIEVAGRFGPEDFDWTYDGGDTNEFYSPRISGAHVLTNNNVLVCVGTSGRFFEIDESENVVWEYINPDGGSIFSQGEIPFSNGSFRATKIGPDNPGLDGRDLTPMGPIENDPIDYGCSIYTSINDISAFPEFTVRPTLVQSAFELFNPEGEIEQLQIFNLNGQKVHAEEIESIRTQIDLSFLASNMYFVYLLSRDGEMAITKVIKG